MPASLPPSDAETLAGLRRRDNGAFALLYTFYYPAVERFVVRNNGTRAHAQDVFQETVLVLLAKVPTEDFTLTSSLKTYILAISSNLWLKRLRQAKRVVETELDGLEPYLPATEPTAFADEADTALQQVQGLLARFSAKCLALVNALFFRSKSIEEVTAENGYTSVHNAQNQKYKCLEQARRGVRASVSGAALKK